VQAPSQSSRPPASSTAARRYFARWPRALAPPAPRFCYASCVVSTLRGGVSLLTAVLLLISGSPAMPVVCFADFHIEMEMPFAGCCAHRSAPAAHAGVSLESSAPNCGNCTDVPLITTAVPHATRDATLGQTACILADARPAAIARGVAPHPAGASLAPSASATPPVSLRC